MSSVQFWWWDLRMIITMHPGFLRPALRPDIPCPHAQEGGDLAVEMPVYKGLAFPFDELFAAVSHALCNRSGYPGWIMKFYVGIRDQVAVLLEIVRDADQLAMPFNDETVVAGHIKTHMEISLRLELFKQVV